MKTYIGVLDEDGEFPSALLPCRVVCGRLCSLVLYPAIISLLIRITELKFRNLGPFQEIRKFDFGFINVVYFKLDLHFKEYINNQKTFISK